MGVKPALRYLLIFCCYCCQVVSFGQSTFDIAGISYTQMLKQNSQSSSTFGDLIQGSFVEYHAFVRLPLVLNEKKTVFINGLEYTQVVPSLTTFGVFENLEQSYYSIKYQLALIQKINYKWQISAGIIPTIASTFTTDISTDDLIVQGFLLGQYIKKDSLQLGLGVAYSTRLGEPNIVPLIQIQYAKNNWTFDAVLPSRLTIYYKKNKWRTGINAAVDGSRYHFGESDILLPLNSIDGIRYTRFLVGPDIQHNIIGGIHLKVHGGLAVNRKYELNTPTSDGFIRINPKTALFFQVGLTYTVHY